MTEARMMVAVVAMACAAGCDQTPTRASGSPTLSAVVVGDAAAALLPDGTFRRDDPTMFGTQVLITAERARELVLAFVNEYAWLQDTWTSGHGAPVRASDLRPCGSTQYVESTYEPIGESVSQLTLKAYGPRYWVAMCNATGTPQLLVAVAALATDVVISTTGLEAAPDHFVTFVATPLPLWWKLPLSAEGAAQEIARLGGARVGSVPRARAVEGIIGFSIAQWSASTDRRLSVESKDGTRRASLAVLTIAQDAALAPEVRLADTVNLLDVAVPGQDVIYTSAGSTVRDFFLARTRAARARSLPARITP